MKRGDIVDLHVYSPVDGARLDGDTMQDLWSGAIGRVGCVVVHVAGPDPDLGYLVTIVTPQLRMGSTWDKFLTPSAVTA